MAKAKFQLEGIGAIAKALNSLEPKIAKKIIRSEIRKALKPIKSEVERQAPVRTGQLKDAVKVKAMKRKKGRIGIMVQVGAGDFKGDTYYAAFVEYGHSTIPRELSSTARGGDIRGAGKSYKAIALRNAHRAMRKLEFGDSKTAPNAFMRRSFDAKSAAARDQIERGILARIDEEISRRMTEATS